MPSLCGPFRNGRDQEGGCKPATHRRQSANQSSVARNGCALFSFRRSSVAMLSLSRKVGFRIDVNLDPRSTNHAHADFWLSETGEGHRADRAQVFDQHIGASAYTSKASRDVISAMLGNAGSEAIAELQREATKESGRLIGRM